MRLILIILISFLFHSNAYAGHNSDHPMTEDEWEEVMEKVPLLDDSAFLPSLLPMILRNRDALNLSDEQLSRFLQWRDENYVNMVNVMNEIIEKKVRFSVESLSTEVSDERLFALQEDIHQLQRELLNIRIGCRDIVMQTFTPEQWEDFGFIVEEYPRIASYFALVPRVSKRPVQ